MFARVRSGSSISLLLYRNLSNIVRQNLLYPKEDQESEETIQSQRKHRIHSKQFRMLLLVTSDLKWNVTKSRKHLTLYIHVPNWMSISIDVLCIYTFTCERFYEIQYCKWVLTFYLIISILEIGETKWISDDFSF